MPWASQSGSSRYARTARTAAAGSPIFASPAHSQTPASSRRAAVATHSRAPAGTATRGTATRGTAIRATSGPPHDERQVAADVLRLAAGDVGDPGVVVRAVEQELGRVGPPAVGGDLRRRPGETDEAGRQVLVEVPEPGGQHRAGVPGRVGGDEDHPHGAAQRLL